MAATQMYNIGKYNQIKMNPCILTAFLSEKFSSSGHMIYIMA